MEIKIIKTEKSFQPAIVINKRVIKVYEDIKKMAHPTS